MVEIWQDNPGLEPPKSSKKMIGLSNQQNGRTPLATRKFGSNNTLDPSSIRRSITKKSQKKKRNTTKSSSKTSTLSSSSPSMTVTAQVQEPTATSTSLVTRLYKEESLDKENNNSLIIDSTNTTQLTDPSAFRRALVRSPQPTPTAASASPLAWNPSLPPITPGERSTGDDLLARELDLDPDQSLLAISPAAPVGRDPLNKVKATKRRGLQPTKLAGRAQRVLVTQEAAPAEPEVIDTTNNVARGENKMTKPEADTQQKPAASSSSVLSEQQPMAKAKANDASDKFQKRIQLANKARKMRAAAAEERERDFRKVEQENNTESSANNLTEIAPVDTMATKSKSKSVSLKIAIPNQDTTKEAVAETNIPLSTTPSGAICMDLSNLFCDAKTATKPPPLTEKKNNTKSKSKPKPPKETSMIFKEEEEISVDSAEKQCNAFTEWLNYTLEPTEEGDEEHESSEKAEFRALVSQQRLAAARLQASKVWKSTNMSKVCDKIRSEIGRGRMKIRDDCDLFANLSNRESVLTLLLSYSTQWLRLGLETLFGETINPFDLQNQEENKLSNGVPLRKSTRAKPLNRMQHALREFIINRVLSDKQVLSKYTKRLCKVPSGKFGTKYQAEIRSLMLYRLVVLVFFLDRAKEANILDKVPRLFSKDGSAKSTRDVLLVFCRNFLSQEGDFVKHLSRLGLKVSYTQEIVDEIDFPVNNLAVDLRDGVRLTRLAEILTEAQAKSLLLKLRLPAVSRLQKLHNVDFVLQTFRDNGVSIGTDIMAHHIVDSHREIVLKLMWAIICRFCLGRLVDEKKIKQEIQRIHALQQRALETTRTNPSDLQKGDEQNRVGLLLMEWCNAVCYPFNVTVSNLTSDFADGVVPCLLLHFYLPNLLQLGQICRTSRTTTFMKPSKAESEVVQRNEQRNCELANNKLHALGGIGRMIPICDSSSLPDPKAMLMCLAFMCSRILDCSNEIRSSITIQRFLRYRRRIILVQRKMQAASFLIGKWKELKHVYYENQKQRYGKAVATIEQFYYCRRHRLEEMKDRRLAWEEIKRKIVVVQSFARRKFAQKAFRAIVHKNLVCTVIQSWWRQVQDFRTLLTLRSNRDAARTIQRAYRWSQEVSRSKNFAAAVIQKQWRAFLGQVQYQIDILDIIAVQSCVRKVLAIRNLKHHISAATAIQHLARKYLTIKHHNATVLQAFYRRARTAKLFWRIKESTTRIQATWRMFCADQKFRTFRHAIMTLQSLQRTRLAMISYQKERSAAIKVQAVTRGMLCRSSYTGRIAEVCLCQASVRRWIASRRVQERRTALVAIQAYERRRQAMHVLLTARAQAVVLQSAWRGFFARSNFQETIQKTVILQKYARGYLQHVRFQRQQRAAIVLESWNRVVRARQKLTALQAERRHLENTAASRLQRHYRGYLIRRELYILHSYAITIQTHFRGFIARITLKSDLVKICITQSTARAWLARRKATKRIDSAVRVQSFCRMALAIMKVEMFRKMISAVTALQCFVRQQQARTISRNLLRERIERDQRHRAAWMIQSKMRSFLSRHRAARTIQATWRCYSVHIDYMLIFLSTIQIQCAARRMLAIKTAKKRLYATTVLRRFGHTAVQKIHAVKLIQRLTRGFFARLQLAIENYAANEVQRVWRGYIANLYYLDAVVSAAMIQSIVRMRQAKQLVEGIKISNAALTIQKRWRRNQTRREFIFTRQQITTFQAMVRAQKVRRQRNKKVKEAATRIRKANRKAFSDPTQTLGARTRWALSVLLRSKSLEKIMNAVRSLEVATRYSRECCQAFANARASEILLVNARSCNRSLPHQELIQYILRTLTNIVQYEDLLFSISSDRWAEFFLDLLQTFRDKDILFYLSATLLEKVIACNEDAKILCSSPENQKRLGAVSVLCKRKASVEAYTPRIRDRGHKRQLSDILLGIRALQRIIRAVEVRG